MRRLSIHATCISLHTGGAWRGALITGASGAGKSDLALRALRAGCALISDDYSCLWTSGGHLYAAAPNTIAGQMEIRGLGVVGVPSRPFTRVHLVAHAQGEAPERMPHCETTDLLDHAVPTVRLVPREASSLDKLLFALKFTTK